jgi:Transposase DDE domain.
MREKCNLLLDESFIQAKRMRLFHDSDVLCLDFHDVIYHGRPQEYTVKTLRDGRKRRVFRFAMAGVCRRGMFYTSRIRPCKKGEDTGHIVRELILGQTPRMVLMDRFFGSVKVFDTVEALGREYIVPCKQTERMDELYKKSLIAGKQRMVHTIRKHGGGRKQVNVYFLTDEDYEYTSYYSNMAVSDNETDDALSIYKIRWNIENQFKKKNEVQAKTSSPSPSYRLLLETISYLLCNLWRLIVNIVQPVTMKKLARALLQLLRLLQEDEETSDKPFFDTA